MSPPVSKKRILTGIGGAGISAGAALAYATAFLNPATALVGTAIGLGVVIYSCVYAKKETVITWEDKRRVWTPDILASSFQDARLNHSETTLTYSNIPSGSDNASLNAGTYTLTANAEETANYKPASKTITIIIEQADQVITWANPPPSVYPVTLAGTELNAVRTGDGALTYTPVLGANLNAGTHTLKVVAAATANYKQAEKTVQFTVEQADQVITWADPPPRVYPVTLAGTELNAVLSVGNGALTYTPVLGANLSAGTHALKVVAAATANYKRAEKTVQFTVEQADQVITWADPAPQVAAAANFTLTMAELNAVQATGNGALTYTPALNANLPSGTTHVLKVEAAATANYKRAEKTVRFYVAPSAEAAQGFNRAKTGTSWLRPAAGTQAGTVLNNWNNNTGNMRTQGQQIMRNLKDKTGPEIVTYMDALVTPLTGGLAANKNIQPGQYPNYIWILPNGLQIRYKPNGDAFSNGAPMFCIEGRTSASFSANQNEIAFKLTSDGQPRAKGPGQSDTNNPYPANPQQADFKQGTAAATHHKVKV